MAQVTIRINGYAYSIGCADGEEDHLEAMGRELDERVEKIKAVAGTAGEARLLVLAALMMADELSDLKGEFSTLRRQVARLQSSPVGEDPKLGRRLGKLAKRAEEIAAGLEHP
ncbi:MAG: cell division protein ZapA [Alphaproteobacteria bacterium]|nr:cell division protein ZapA [Alphaproteobacteria bacterium]